MAKKIKQIEKISSFTIKSLPEHLPLNLGRFFQQFWSTNILFIKINYAIIQSRHRNNKANETMKLHANCYRKLSKNFIFSCIQV